MPLRHMYSFIYIFKPDNCFSLLMRIIRYKLLFAVYAVYILLYTAYCLRRHFGSSNIKWWVTKKDTDCKSFLICGLWNSDDWKKKKKGKAEGNWHFNSMWLSFLVAFRHFYFYFFKLGSFPSRKLWNYCTQSHI